jgi:hypothetical protein
MKTATIMAMFGLSAACAGPTLQPTPAGTVILGQIAYLPAPDEMIKGFTFAPQPAELNGVPVQAQNYVTKAEIKAVEASCGLVAGTKARFAVVRLYYFPMRDYVGLRMRWILVEARGLTVVDPDLTVEGGNVVEVEMRAGHSKSRCPTVIKMKASSLATGSCRYVDNLTAASDKLGNGMFHSLDCPLLQSEGWQEVHPPLKWGEGGNWVSGYGYDGVLWIKGPSGHAP